MGAVIWERNREGHKSVIEKSLKVMKQRIGGVNSARVDTRGRARVAQSWWAGSSCTFVLSSPFLLTFPEDAGSCSRDQDAFGLPQFEGHFLAPGLF